jgi:hypothetical protein
MKSQPWFHNCVSVNKNLTACDLSYAGMSTVEQAVQDLSCDAGDSDTLATVANKFRARRKEKDPITGT